MKKTLLLLSITILTINCYSQILFEKGYYISNDNQKVDCLIKNKDWADNPTFINCKLSDNGEIKTITIQEVKEFGVNNLSKYIRKRVNIDRSSESLSDMSNNKNPIFNEEELFLKVLVEGKANLYFYGNGDLKRFFFSTDSSDIKQLIFKSYKTKENQIGKNNSYKQQLWNELKCPDFSVAKIEDLDYWLKDLVGFFIEYNECNSHEIANFYQKQKKDLFNLNIRPGMNISSLSIQNDYAFKGNADFGVECGFRFGLETELLLPFNKNKWAFIIEPTYQYFKSETANAKVDYKSIEFPLGIRYYFFFNENSKGFINGSYVFDFGINSSISIANTVLDINNSHNLAFGLGYKYNDRYSLELRYLTKRDITTEYALWGAYYKTLSIIFGYSLF